MKLDLTTFERMQLMQWVSLQRGNVGLLRTGIRLMDKLEPKEAEKEKVGWRVLADGRPVWLKTDVTFNMELDADEWTMLQGAPEWDGWICNADVLAMLEKIEGAQNGE